MGSVCTKEYRDNHVMNFPDQEHAHLVDKDGSWKRINKEKVRNNII